MNPRPLDLEVLRNNRVTEARFSVHADLDDVGRLERYLRDWLVQGKWGKPLWPQFELVVRKHGEWKIQRRVRI
jgi:hypothetical protein